MEKILITGATGFIGSFIVEEALRRGMDVWAAVRKSSSLEYLQDSRIHLIELNLASQSTLEHQLKDVTFDYVVHAAGATKCIDTDDFFHINYGGTRNLVEALRALKMPLRKFVMISSLSVCGAIRERQPYEPILESDAPVPNTAYGESKLRAERYFETVRDFPCVILRPTGVYGPREKDYFLMAKSIKGHVDFAVGFQQQDITFVHVLDVVQAVFLAMEKGKPGRKYFLTDGRVYNSRTFSDLIHKELGEPWWIRITAPLWVLRIVASVGDTIGHLTGRMSALNNDKYHILKQRNWQCDIRPAIDELGYNPQWQLEQGVPMTIAWYKEKKWL